MAIKIAPSILSADFAKLGEQVKMVEDAGAELLHIDVMDGHFVPNITIGPLVVQSLRKHSKLEFDVHLMIDNPEKYIEDFARAGADIITVHVESTRHIHRLVQQIKACGIKAAVALNPGTPLETLPYILTELDMILLMTVNPGFGGQKFIEIVVPKIAALSALLRKINPNCAIQVDGGINPDTAQLVSRAGAQILVAGAAIFGADDPRAAIQTIRKAADAANGAG